VIDATTVEYWIARVSYTTLPNAMAAPATKAVSSMIAESSWYYPLAAVKANSASDRSLYLGYWEWWNRFGPIFNNQGPAFPGV
jgi:hypothetical protein